MTYIIHYIIALTFGILGWQFQTSEFEDSLEVLTSLSNSIDSRIESEKTTIDSDTFFLFKDFQVDLRSQTNYKHPN